MTRSGLGLITLLAAAFLSCGRIGYDPATGLEETGCPADMIGVPMADTSVCVDRYEATVFGAANCIGARFGEGDADDYPSGFPDLVESVGCAGSCEGSEVVAATQELYACSLVGARPSGTISWFQAKRACENVGKRLCSNSEWQSACAGPENRAFPYGDVYDAARCNGGDPAMGGSWESGSQAPCEGGWPGLFDLSGNMSEWASTCDGNGNCYRHGGSFVDFENLGTLRCHTGGDRGVEFPRNDVGFRCCRAPAP